jgi:hypothetical protein
MVDFNQKAARKFCRYTRCRMKLPEPTTNLHEAFCAGGCYESFHLTPVASARSRLRRNIGRSSRSRMAIRLSL